MRQTTNSSQAKKHPNSAAISLGIIFMGVFFIESNDLRIILFEFTVTV